VSFFWFHAVFAVSPEIRLPNSRIAQTRGRETILECHITAHPHAVNYWHKDGRRIISSARFALHLSPLHATIFTQLISQRIDMVTSSNPGQGGTLKKNTLRVQLQLLAKTVG